MHSHPDASALYWCHAQASNGHADAHDADQAVRYVDVGLPQRQRGVHTVSHDGYLVLVNGQTSPTR